MQLLSVLRGHLLLLVRYLQASSSVEQLQGPETPLRAAPNPLRIRSESASGPGWGFFRELLREKAVAAVAAQSFRV